jgi:ATP-dependent Clp protease ATP-binding subunit ClpC
MFQRFTRAARDAVILGQEDARELGHGKIGTEHLLLGLLHDEGAPAARALAGIGITRAAAREGVVAQVGAGSGRTIGELPFTDRAKQALEDALREALERRDRRIAPEHILLGLTRRDDSTAVKVLRGLGTDCQGVRSALERQGPTDDGDALLALVADTDGVAARALASLGIDAEALRRAVEEARRDR